MHSLIPSLFLLLLFFFFFFLCFAHAHGTDDHDFLHRCRPERCSPHEPLVQFPFLLEDHQHANCGYHPDFKLSCDGDGQTTLRVPNTPHQSLVVKSIDYKNQSVLLHDPNSCLPFWITNLGLLGFSAAASPYHSQNNYTLFKCPPPERTRLTELGCLSKPGPDKVYAVDSDSYVGDSPLVYCERNSPNRSLDLLPDYIENIIAEARFHWEKPDCRSCKKSGWSCGLDGSNNITCLPLPSRHLGIVLIALG